MAMKNLSKATLDAIRAAAPGTVLELPPLVASLTTENVTAEVIENVPDDTHNRLTLRLQWFGVTIGQKVVRIGEKGVING